MARVLGAVKVQVHVIVSSPLKRSLQTVYFFFFNDTAPTKIYTLSLHDALPICSYPLAVELEDARRFVRDITVAHFGRSWRKETPRVLSARIRSGRLGDDVTRS